MLHAQIHGKLKKKKEENITTRAYLTFNVQQKTII